MLTEDGLIVEEALKRWLLKFPVIKLGPYVIMPDHIHLCVDVSSYLKNGLSRAIAGLMGLCTSLSQYDHFFSKGFNDKIAYTEEQWVRQRAYVEDNPRRLLIKRLHPEYFRRKWEIAVGDKKFIAIGNIFLLKSPEIHVVRFSRKFSEAEYAERVGIWKNAAANGATFISPYIHPNEKDVRDYAIAESGSIIRVCENGFAERFAPQGKEFELMSAERLLLIGAQEYNSQREDITYRRAQQLNRLSEEIARIDWGKEKARIRNLG